MVSTLKHDLCVNKKFSIAFHIVLDSNYQLGGVTLADLNTCVNNLNAAFKRICVQFQNCHVDSIPNYNYNYWTKPATDATVSPNWDMTNVINLYLVDTIVGFPSGYAYFPGGKDVIVVEKGSTLSNVPIHEMGHFFGLVHTFDEINSATTGTVTPPPANLQVTSYEFVRRTNCYDHGDGFCDTEADCYPAGYDKNTGPCQHIPGTFDGYGEYYVPPVDNYMTYFGCGCRFTQEQYNFMALVILSQRMYLH